MPAQLAGWGEAVFAAVFGAGPARDAYQRARDRRVQVVFRSGGAEAAGAAVGADARSGWAGGAGPGGGEPEPAGRQSWARRRPGAGGRLRVLMVISRPAGTADIGYQMIARPLLERLDAVRGQVELVVLRPPTLEALPGLSWRRRRRGSRSRWCISTATGRWPATGRAGLPGG